MSPNDATAQSVSRLLKAGYAVTEAAVSCSRDERTQRGVMLFVKRAPSFPIEKTALFKQASKIDKRNLKGLKVEGESLDEVEVPFVAKLKFGKPRARR